MPDYPIRVLERTAEILEAIKNGGGNVGVSMISRSTGLPKSTVFRILSSLVELGFVRRLADGDQYALGYRLMQLSFLAVGDWEVVSLAMPYLEELKEETRETAALAIRRNLHYSFIAQVSCLQEYRVNAALGEKYFLHWAGTGKAILAFSPEPILTEILKMIPENAATGRTIRKPEELISQIDRIRENGFAYSYSERIEGGASISAPVLDHNGIAKAAISIIGPEVRIQKLDRDLVGSRLMEIASQLSRIYQGFGVRLEYCD